MVKRRWWSVVPTQNIPVSQPACRWTQWAEDVAGIVAKIWLNG